VNSLALGTIFVRVYTLGRDHKPDQKIQNNYKIVLQEDLLTVNLI
jgi:hypothetical protein